MVIIITLWQQGLDYISKNPSYFGKKIEFFFALKVPLFNNYTFLCAQHMQISKKHLQVSSRF